MMRFELRPLAGLFVFLALGLSTATIGVAQDTHPLIVEADSIVAGLTAVQAEYRELEERLPSLSGEDSVVTARRMTDMVVDALDEINQLADLVVRQEEEGLDSSRFRTYLTDILSRVPIALGVLEDDVLTSLASAEERAKSADPGELGLIEADIARLNERLDNLFGQEAEYVESLERMGMDDSAARAKLSEELEQRAQLIAGRLERAIRERDRYNAQAEQYPDEASYRQRADAAQAAIDGEVGSLESTADTMDRLGLEVTEYRTLLVEATGELARGLGDAKVAMNLLQRGLAKIRDWVFDSGPRLLVKVLVLLVILTVFRFLSRLTRKAVVRSIDKSRLQPSQLMRNMISNMTGNLVMAFGLLVALSQIGVSMGPLLAGLGVAGFIVGFALQETLANFAAGLMILFYRPYDVGDMVEAATVFGKVHHMSLVSTTILTIDNQTLIVPNGKIWGDVIKNVTAQNVRRVDMKFGISYTDDIPKAEGIMESILEKHDKILDDPEPVVKLHELGESSVNFVVRPWVKTDDYWDVYWDVTREVKMRFDAEGVSIPFPQRDVHLYEESLQQRPQAE
jgi:small conductance mechanosensitive channel